jgi:hypothetical protein
MPVADKWLMTEIYLQQGLQASFDISNVGRIFPSGVVLDISHFWYLTANGVFVEGCTCHFCESG